MVGRSLKAGVERGEGHIASPVRKQREMTLVSPAFSFGHFYSVEDPSPWNSDTQFLDGSSHFSYPNLESPAQSCLQGCLLGHFGSC